MNSRKAKTFSFTTRYVFVFGILLLLTNVVLGLVLMNQSSETITELVRKNMLDISNTAAGIVDGDALGALTEESVGGEAYQEIYDQLSVFQKNVDIEYIYAVRQVGEEEFIFTVDPDPEDPADFGEDVLITPALIAAGKGIATVDAEPAQDEWGNFYSSYSPVFDSRGNVSGIIGIDFNSEWYDLQIREHTLSITIITFLSILLCGLIVFLLTNNIRKRFDDLGNELTLLSGDIDELAREITSSRDYQESGAGNKDSQETKEDAGSGDEIEVLGEKVRSMHKDMKLYLDFVHSKALTDGLTGVGNSTAYLETQKALKDKISENKAAFCLALFDINDLKKVNDRYGHECGDRIIRGAAEVIEKTMGAENTFRIGGDEFISIREGITEEEMKRLVRTVEERVKKFNEEHSEETGTLSLSCGTAEYHPETDRSFREVFVRADEAMYQKKGEYHSKSASNA